MTERFKLGDAGESEVIDASSIQQIIEDLTEVLAQQIKVISAAEARVTLLDWLKPETDFEYEVMTYLMLKIRDSKGNYPAQLFDEDKRADMVAEHANYLATFWAARSGK